MRRLAMIGTAGTALCLLSVGALSAGGVQSAVAAQESPLSEPALASTGTGLLDAFYRDPVKGTLKQQSFRRGGWSSTVDIGGPSLYGPGAAGDTTGKLLVARVAPDRTVWVRVASKGVWGGWTSLGGQMTSAVAVASLGNGSFAVVGRGQNSAAYARFLNGSRWSPWRSAGGQMSTAPAAAGQPGGSVVIAAATTNKVLSTRTITPVASDRETPWAVVDGLTTTHTPSITRSPDNGELQLVATDEAGKVMHRQHDWVANRWVWVTVAEGFRSGPAVAVSGPLESDLVAFSTGGSLMQTSLSRQNNMNLTVAYQWTPVMPVAPPATGPGTTNRISVSSDGAQSDSGGGLSAISTDGRFISFESGASNLVPGDTNNTTDVFVRDQKDGSVKRVSLTPGGTQRTRASSWPTMSGDGRYIAYLSPGDPAQPGPRTSDEIFVHDNKTGQTKKLGMALGEGSADGTYDSLTFSADATHLAFNATTSNLVPGETKDRLDVIVVDVASGQVELASAGLDGTPGNKMSWFQGAGPHLSSDGRYVAFTSFADNLVEGEPHLGSEVFVRDLRARTTIRAAVTAGGAETSGSSGSPSISADGRYVAFASPAADLVADDTNDVGDVFIRDLTGKTTTRLGLAAGGEIPEGASRPSLSADGQHVMFESSSPNLVTGDTNHIADGFVRELKTGVTHRVTVSNAGAQSSAPTLSRYALSGDGRYALYDAFGNDLVLRDSNRSYDVFLHQVW